MATKISRKISFKVSRNSICSYAIVLIATLITYNRICNVMMVKTCRSCILPAFSKLKIGMHLIIIEHLPKGALQDEGTRYIRPFEGWHPPHDPPQTADTLVWSGDFVKFIIRLPFGAPQDAHLISSRNPSPVPERSNWNPPRRHSPSEKQSPPLPNFTGFPSEMANLKSFCFTNPFLGFTRILLNLKRIEKKL